MIPQEFEYSAPAQLSEALALIANGAKPLAGGMSLVPMMKLRLATPEHVVDIRRLKDLSYIRQDGDQVRIGAMNTHHEIESSAVLLNTCPLLARTAAHIGDVQVRNMGTIGGSVAHADPSADYLAALFALDAQVTLSSVRGQRTLTIDKFILDPFTTAIEADELLSEISVPVERAGSAYVKMSNAASGFALVGVAARIRRSGDKVEFAAIGLTGVGATAFRAKAAESKLAGTAGSDADIRAAASLACDGIEASSDLHASAEYRKHLAGVHTARAIRLAMADAAARA